MSFFVLIADQPGELGDDCKGDFSVWPPKLEELDFQIDAQVIDDIFAVPGALIVTDALYQALKKSKATGFEAADMTVTETNQYDEMYSDKVVPKCMWLKVKGAAGVDDFGLSKDGDFVLSAKVVEIIRSFRFEYGELIEYGAR